MAEPAHPDRVRDGEVGPRPKPVEPTRARHSGVPATARPRPVRMSPIAMQRLGRAAGNRAVSGLVGRPAPANGTPAANGSDLAGAPPQLAEVPVIQRYAGIPKAAVPPSPPAPNKDPRFTKVTKASKDAAKALKTHPTGKVEAQKAQKAAKPPADDKVGQGKAAQVAEMSAAKVKGFDKAGFIAAVKQAISAAAPKNLDEADKFGDSGKAEGVKSAVAGKVADGKKSAAEDVKSKAEKPPDTSKAVEKPVTPLEPTKPNQPAEMKAGEAMPAPAPPEQTDFRNGPAETATKMSEAKVTEQQLTKSNEPAFVDAATAKKAGDQHSAKAPAEVRKAEGEVLKGASADAKASGTEKLAGMTGVAKKAVGDVTKKQGATKDKDEEARQKFTAKINDVYEGTKRDVEGILNGLDSKVDKAFTDGEAGARAAFTADHKRRMQEYKDKRYSGLEGAWNWTADLFTGLPPEANALFQESRKLYESKMEKVISDVADIVGGELTAAKQKIADGRAKIEKEVSTLPKNLQSFGSEAAKEMGGKFDELDKSVDEKQDALASDLAQKYVAARNEVDEEIKAAQAANSGLWDAAKAAIGGAIKTILELKDMLLGVLRKAADAIDRIITDPIGFLKNLVTAVKNGVMRFADNILEHLKKGLLGWLFGALGSAGIEIPDTFDLKGVLKLVLSVLGLTWQAIRGRIVKIVGEPAMNILEGTVGMFKVLVTDGLPGIWKLILEKMTDFSEMVIGKIKEFVVEKIVKAGITWLIAMLNPAAAFIKACKMIYDVVMFFVERGSQIMGFVNTVIDSISDIAKGGLGGVPEKIEKSLADFLPLAISFLASLLGLGGISDKIKSVIDAVRKPIGKVLDTVIGGVVKLTKPIWGPIKNGIKRGKDVVNKVKAKAKEKYEQGKKWVKEKAGKAKDWVKRKLKPREKTFAMSGQSHQVIAEGERPILQMASVKQRLSQKLMATLNGIKKRETALNARDPIAAAEKKELKEIPRRIKDLQEIRKVATATEKLQAQIENTEDDGQRAALEKKLDAALSDFCALAGAYGDRYKATDIVPPANVSADEEAAIKSAAGATAEKDIKKRGTDLKDKALTTEASLAANPNFEAAAKSFEKRLGGLAFNHPKANQAAADMCAAAKRYLVAKAKEPWDKNSAVLGASLKGIGSDQPAWSGSVGKEVVAMMDVFDRGNINERITAVESFMVNVIGKDLTEDNDAKFQAQFKMMEEAGMNAAALESRRNKNVGGTPDKWNVVNVPTAPPVAEGRAVDDQWHSRAERHPEGDPKRQSDQPIADTGASLSDREKALIKAKDPAWDESKPVKWHEGMRVWMLNERDKWVAAHRKLSIPLGAGPSGSTNMYMQAARVLGVRDAPGARLACIAALLPAHHHTLVEILTGAAAQGMPFTPGQKMYRDIRPLSEAELRSCGENGKFPDEVAGEKDAAVAAAKPAPAKKK